MLRTQSNRSLVLFLGVFAAVLGAVPPVFGAVFLRIDGIAGESTDEAHKEWIDVLSFSHSISPPVEGGCRASGRTDVRSFSVTKAVDKASKDLQTYCANGEHIPKVEVEFCQDTGDEHCFLKFIMKDVIVTSVSPSGSADGDRPTEEVSFAYERIEREYTPIDEPDAQFVPCLWDLDGGGSVGGDDLLLMLTFWGDPYGAADLVDMLTAWGPCTW